MTRLAILSLAIICALAFGEPIIRGLGLCDSAGTCPVTQERNF